MALQGYPNIIETEMESNSCCVQLNTGLFAARIDVSRDRNTDRNGRRFERREGLHQQTSRSYSSVACCSTVRRPFVRPSGGGCFLTWDDEDEASTDGARTSPINRQTAVAPAVSIDCCWGGRPCVIRISIQLLKNSKEHPANPFPRVVGQFLVSTPG